jgi:methylmalonyl-CoA mutase N-terminal domain/subunit
VNVPRVTIQALAAVLGGTQSLHTNGYDEALALPTEASATLALRTQQILGYESGVPEVVDPLAGSYYVECLTDSIEAGARELIAEVDRLGGAAKAIERGFFQEAIARSAYELQKAQESGERVVVGVNRYTDDSPPLAIETPDFSALAAQQRARLAEVKRRRDAKTVKAALGAIAEAASGSGPLMPAIIDAVRTRATLGEISDALRTVWGVYRPS